MFIPAGIFLSSATAEHHLGPGDLFNERGPIALPQL